MRQSQENQYVDVEGESGDAQVLQNFRFSIAPRVCKEA